MIISVLPTKRPDFYDKIIEFLGHQTIKPNAAVIPVPNSQLDISKKLADGLKGAGVSKVIIQDDKGSNLSRFYARAFDTAAEMDEAGFMMLMSDDCWYEPGFVEETRNMFLLHPEAAVVGKTRFRVRYIGMNREGHEECHGSMQSDGRTDWVQGDTVAVNIKTYKENPTFRCGKTEIGADWELVGWAVSNNFPVYSTGVENFYYQRYTALHNHTWRPERYE